MTLEVVERCEEQVSLLEAKAKGCGNCGAPLRTGKRYCSVQCKMLVEPGNFIYSRAVLLAFLDFGGEGCASPGCTASKEDLNSKSPYHLCRYHSTKLYLALYHRRRPEDKTLAQAMWLTCDMVRVRCSKCNRKFKVKRKVFRRNLQLGYTFRCSSCSCKGLGEKVSGLCPNCGSEVHKQTRRLKRYGPQRGKIARPFCSDACSRFFVGAELTSRCWKYTPELLRAMMTFEGVGCAFPGCEEEQATKWMKRNPWHACRRHHHLIWMSLYDRTRRRRRMLQAACLSGDNLEEFANRGAERDPYRDARKPRRAHSAAAAIQQKENSNGANSRTGNFHEMESATDLSR